MKAPLIILLILLPLGFISAQRIGKMAPEKVPEVFPPNTWGADIMFGEGGFGLGTFYRKNFSRNVAGFVDLSFSEAKDDREIEYVDYYGNTWVFNKQNRVFLMPLNFGLQYRLFSDILTENFRPYVTFGVGPTFVITTPYEREFFNSIGYAKVNYAAGGYFGLGANIGSSKSNVVGLNVRYYYSHLFNGGVENLIGHFQKDLGGIYISLNLGIMY